MSARIIPIDVHTFNDAVRLVMVYFKDYKNTIINRVEAQRILQKPENSIYVLLYNHNVRGVYVYEEAEGVYTVKVFVLDPLVRGKKVGYLLWKHMNTKLGDKPAIIAIDSLNTRVESLVRKRGKFIGTYLGVDGSTLNYYNLSFKDMK